MVLYKSMNFLAVRTGFGPVISTVVNILRFERTIKFSHYIQVHFRELFCIQCGILTRLN